MSDMETLERLNRDYISSVQNSDVRRFDQILATEFYCSNPDGSLVDRAAFLEQTARPVTIRDLEARDVVIRLFGPPGHEDMAIIHARTTYKTRRRGQIRPLYRRMGAAERNLARGVRARNPRITIVSRLIRPKLPLVSDGL